MKLFVIDKNNSKKYLREEAYSKEELASKIGGRTFILDGQRYSVNDVIAESDLSNTFGGAILGGLIGTFLIPGVFLLTGTLGGLIGNSTDNEEAKKVENFNKGRIEKV
jgi:hypothetical protein